jgi:hypothetical protein
MSLRQRSEPTLVQALVAELAVEALHVVVLRWLAGLDQPQLDAAFARPLVEGSSGELGTLIGAQGLRPRWKPRNRVQDASDVLAGDAMIDDDVDRLLAEVVDDRQALQPPAVLEGVAHEVHRPHLVRTVGLDERPTLNGNTLAASIAAAPADAPRGTADART